MKVLIIDDEPSIRVSLSRVFQGRGHTVQVAPSGVEGLDLWRLFRPHITFLDMIMPDMHGREVLKQASIFNKGKVVLISSHDSKTSCDADIQSGRASLFVKKPFFNIFHLAEEVENLL